MRHEPPTGDQRTVRDLPKRHEHLSILAGCSPGHLACPRLGPAAMPTMNRDDLDAMRRSAMKLNEYQQRQRCAMIGRWMQGGSMNPPNAPQPGVWGCRMTGSRELDLGAGACRRAWGRRWGAIYPYRG